MAIFFNLTNSQQFRVNLSWPFVPFVTPAFWKTGTVPQATTLNMPRQDGKWWIYPTSLDITLCVGEGSIDITLCYHLLSLFARHRTTEIAFSETFVNIRFIQVFNIWCFSQIVMFPSRNQRVLSSILIKTIIHICARFWSLVLWNFEDNSNSISLHLVLLSSYKALKIHFYF